MTRHHRLGPGPRNGQMIPAAHLPDGTCQGCDKRYWTTRAAAKAFARVQHPATALRAYSCPSTDGWWHIGNTRTDRKRGLR